MEVEAGAGDGEDTGKGGGEDEGLGSLIGSGETSFAPPSGTKGYSAVQAASRPETDDGFGKVKPLGRDVLSVPLDISLDPGPKF